MTLKKIKYIGDDTFHGSLTPNRIYTVTETFMNGDVVVNDNHGVSFLLVEREYSHISPLTNEEKIAHLESKVLKLERLLYQLSKVESNPVKKRIMYGSLGK